MTSGQVMKMLIGVAVAIIFILLFDAFAGRIIIFTLTIGFLLFMRNLRTDSQKTNEPQNHGQ